MSKNFELMQSSGIDLQSPPVRPPQPGLRLTEDREAYRIDRGSPLDRRAQEESAKLVQRIFLQADDGPRVVVFAGIDHGNGCSRVCAQSAEILARHSPGTVCIVEANLRSPSLPGLFGVANQRGLTDAVLKEGPIKDFAHRLLPQNLWLLSCGSLTPDFADLLSSEKLKSRLCELRREFDYVLVDAPPLNPYTDATTLGRLCDGMVLVLEASSTRREAARKVTESLRAAQIEILGAVLNKRAFPIPESLYRKL